MKQLALFLIVGCIVAPLTGWSASVIKMDIDDLTKRSDLAVVGTVTSISHQNKADRYPETLYRVEVSEVFYGADEPTEVTVCLPGGPAGEGITTFVPGMPKFTTDEKVALFLVIDPDRNVAVPTGLEQGVLRIKIHPETKEEYVVNQTVSIDIGSTSQSTAKSESVKSLTLSDFGKVVKDKALKLKKKK